MAILLSFLVTLFLFSCQSKKEEVTDFNDLTQASKKDYDSEDVKESNHKKKIFFNDSLNTLSKDMTDFLEYQHTQVFRLDTLFFPDRFGAKQSEKLYFKSEKDSLVYFHWEFKDSIQTYNTFYNWLDCFGKKCKSIHIGDKIAFSSRGTLFLIQDKDIFYFESNFPVDYKKILDFYDSQKRSKNWKFLINQVPRKKADWFQRNSDGKIEKLVYK